MCMCIYICSISFTLFTGTALPSNVMYLWSCRAQSYCFLAHSEVAKVRNEPSSHLNASNVPTESSIFRGIVIGTQMEELFW